MLSRLVALIVASLLLVGSIYYFTREGDVRSDDAEDLPQVVRIPGGMLEVATIARSEIFELQRPTTIIVWKTNLCRETAEVRFRAYTTYRVRLARNWGGEVRDGALYVRTPPLEPLLPVAFDTGTLRREVDKCWFIPNRGTLRDLEREITERLNRRAQSSAYKNLAEANGARDTVEEFVRKWLLTQTRYASLPDNIPVHVTIAD